MSGDVWQVERYNLRKRTWEPFGRPSTDFAAQYKKVSALQACGSKARLAKVQRSRRQRLRLRRTSRQFLRARRKQTTPFTVRLHTLPAQRRAWRSNEWMIL